MVIIEHARVKGVAADFVKQEVKITLTMSLAAGLIWQTEIAEYAASEVPVTLHILRIRSPRPALEQLPLAPQAEPEAAAEAAAPVAPETPADPWAGLDGLDLNPDNPAPDAGGTASDPDDSTPQ